MIAATGLGVELAGSPVVSGVDLAVRPGEVVGVIGPNGSGKTTLLRTLFAALAPRAGIVTLDGGDLHAMAAAARARRIAVVTQAEPSEIPMRVADLVLLGRSPHRSSFQAYTEGDHRLAAAALERVDALHLRGRDVTTLSGGERQRVLVARAVAQGGDYLLLDEPTNHLDPRFQHEVLAVVRGTGAGVVAVLHDVNLAVRYCDRIVVLDGGRVVGSGVPGDVCSAAVLTDVYRTPVDVITHRGRPLVIFRGSS